MLTGSLVVPHCATARWPCVVLNVCQYGLVWSYIVPRWPCVVLYFAERIQCGLACCWDCHDYSQRVQCGFILCYKGPIWRFIVLRLSAQWKTTSWFGPSFCRCAENVLHVWRFIVQRGPIKNDDWWYWGGAQFGSTNRAERILSCPLYGPKWFWQGPLVLLRGPCYALHSTKRVQYGPLIFLEGPVWSKLVLIGSSVVLHCASMALCGPILC